MQEGKNPVWELLNLFETAVDCEIREPDGKLNKLFGDSDVETVITEDTAGNQELIIQTDEICYTVTIKKESLDDCLTRIAVTSAQLASKKDAIKNE